MNRGKRLVEILKQPQYQPLPVEKQVAIIFAANNGYLDNVAVDKLRAYEESFFRYFDTQKPDVLTAIRDKKILDDDTKAALKGAIEEFGKQFAATTVSA